MRSRRRGAGIEIVVAGTAAAAVLALPLVAASFGAERTAPVTPVVALSGEEVVKTWPDSARRAAASMIDRYGLPHEVTETMLVWHDVAPWKRVTAWQREVQHDFPYPHADVLEQVIDYRVPAEKADELAFFDGSILVDRTKGELAARGPSEEMNRLALNLAHEVIQGKRSVENARRFFAQAAAEPGTSHPYRQKLQFKVARGNTGDVDQSFQHR